MEIVKRLYDERGDLLTELESDFYRADGAMQHQLAAWMVSYRAKNSFSVLILSFS